MMYKIFSEQLNKKIILQQPTEITTDTGTTKLLYDDDGLKVSANIEPYQSIIYHGNALKVDEVLYRVIIRYRSGISTDTRIIYGGRILFQTQPPQNMQESNYFLLLTCKELINDG